MGWHRKSGTKLLELSVRENEWKQEKKLWKIPETE
jgi:hypothetical protein